MLECRYSPECRLRVDRPDHPCVGLVGELECGSYKPMPDVDALRAIADDMGRIADENRMTGMMSIGRARLWADRIREALGVDE